MEQKKILYYSIVYLQFQLVVLIIFENINLKRELKKFTKLSFMALSLSKMFK